MGLAGRYPSSVRLVLSRVICYGWEPLKACPQIAKAFTMTDVKLDCRGLNCPIPIVRISQAIRKMGASQTLEVEADDPAFGADVDAWVRKMGHELVAFDEGAVQRAIIRKV
jgi:tRNA 2-thiouridine synthesizing protein A